MEKLLFGWVAGIALLLWRDRLPSALEPVVWLLAAMFALLMARARAGVMAAPLRAIAVVSCGLAAGVAVSGRDARQQLADWLPSACEGRVMLVSGRVDGLPEPMLPEGVRFRFRPDPGQGPCVGERARWQLSWPSAGVIRPDERWRLRLQLRRPSGLSNPGGFDAERWWHQERVTATGRVREGGRLRVVGTTLDGLRWRIRQQLLGRFPQQPEAAGTVLALLTGDRAGITTEAWERYARTGITHLVAISGLHLTCLAWLAGRAARMLWTRLPGAALCFPAGRVASLFGLLVATGYGLLAGMELPAQRTLFMLAVITGMRWLPGECSGRQALLLALALVLLLDPLAVHAVGLWLSFAAVALLMAGGMTPGEEGGWRAAVRAQWLATWGLLPLTLAVFARISWVSLPVNLLAIPWVTFAVVPLAMLGLALQVCWPAAGELAWTLAVWLMAVLDDLLARLAAWPGAASELALPGLTPLWLGLTVALALMPRALPGRTLACLPLLAVCWPQPSLESGQLRLTVLDVGQGLAVHVQTARHNLLFDTGPPQGSHADAGSRVILPYLRWSGVRRLDALVFSHDHLDHTGGGGAVLAGLPVRQVWGRWPSTLAAWPLKRRPQRRDCRAGRSWQWDGVRFAFLWPLPDVVASSENDRSCVLRIEVGGQVILLPGDLEAHGELVLLAQAGPEVLRADLLVLGHHGSRTSTTASFLAAVRPREVVAAVGRRNRYRHPSRVVLRRLAAAGVPGWRSDETGALRYDFVRQGKFPLVRRWRLEAGHYWLPPGGKDLSMLGALPAFP